MYLVVEGVEASLQKYLIAPQLLILDIGLQRTSPSRLVSEGSGQL